MTTTVKFLKCAIFVFFRDIAVCVPVLFLVSGANISLAAENVGSIGSALTGGANDAGPNVLNANVVVRLSTGGTCTGTLLTPTLVLTARHCINGNAGGFSTIIAGQGRTPQVDVGPTTAAIQTFLSVKSVVFGEPIGGPYQPRDPKTIPENMGNDIAVVFLNPQTPVLNQAVIKRLAFRGPILGGRDVNGGIYRPAPGEQFGMAGWSPTGSTGPGGVSSRQVSFFTTLGIHHYPGRPEHTTGVADGQYWLRNLTGPVTWPGDSGSPVFIQHADGSREVFGVLSGTTNESKDDIDCSGNCALYTDISRGAPKEWLLSVVQDNTRSVDWLRFHKRQDVWFGEVDYTGPCQQGRDFDCDGWYDENDYCPGTFNPDQIEGATCPPVVLSRQPSSDTVSRTPDHLDVFWVGPDGGVGTNWWDANVNNGQWNQPFPIAPPKAAEP
jgi:Trypsin